jgi:hypothetical protein
MQVCVVCSQSSFLLLVLFAKLYEIFEKVSNLYKVKLLNTIKIYLVFLLNKAFNNLLLS